jgi:hypothetical protein
MAVRVIGTVGPELVQGSDLRAREQNRNDIDSTAAYLLSLAAGKDEEIKLH